MRYQFYTADVFTKQIFGGNQLAVFPQATGLTSLQMQQIAREFNYSETVFVLPPETVTATRRLRIFTPGGEIPFAGHPTVGVAYVLASIGEIPLTDAITKVIFEEGIGAVPVKICAENNQPIYTELTTAQLPEFSSETPTIESLAAMLSLSADDLFTGEYCPETVSCGLPFLFIPLRSREAIARAELNLQLWQDLLASYLTPHIYIFSFDAELAGSDVRARMFAPALGIVEDPATGSAATALAGYLGKRHSLSDGTLTWVIEQGFEMGRPSLLQVEADKQESKIREIRVGGSSVLVSQGIMTI